MLSRILDRKKPPSGAGPTGHTSGQGSLLDLMGTADSLVSSSLSRSPDQAAPLSVGDGSILTELNQAEARENQRLRQEHAQLQAAAEAERYRMSQQPHYNQDYPSYPAEYSGQVSPAMRSTRRSPQAEQLDFLADELAELRSTVARRKRERDNGPYFQPANDRHAAGRPPPPPTQTYFPMGGAGPAGPSGPLSFDSFMTTLFSSWKLVALLGFCGFLTAAAYALTLPNMYLSVAEVLLEPRGIKVLDNSVSPNGLNGDATVAYAESQVRIMNSSSVIDPVIEELDLTVDPEFNGGSFGSGGILSLISRSLSGGTSPGEQMNSVREHVHDNLYVERINQTFTILLGISTTDPEKSARIANALARSYLVDESGARSSVARSASQGLSGRLEELRKEVLKNEERVERYKAENDLVDTDGRLVSEVQLAQLNEQLVLARVQVGDARTRAKLAAQTDLGDVLSGSLPSTLSTQTVNQLRIDYARANSRLKRVAAKLGQLHPDRIAAESERRSSLNTISEELKRIVKTAQENYKRAKARQEDLIIQLNQLKATAVTDSAAKVKLRELNRQVEASRRIYEAVLLRSREIGEQENINSSSARVISEAVPVYEKTSPNRKLIVLIGILAGAGFGMVLALVPWFFTGLRSIARGGGAPRGPSRMMPVQHQGDLYSSRPDPVPYHYPANDTGSPGHSQLPLPGIGTHSAWDNDMHQPASGRHPQESYYSSWNAPRSRF